MTGSLQLTLKGGDRGVPLLFTRKPQARQLQSFEQFQMQRFHPGPEIRCEFHPLRRWSRSCSFRPWIHRLLSAREGSISRDLQACCRLTSYLTKERLFTFRLVAWAFWSQQQALTNKRRKVSWDFVLQTGRWEVCQSYPGRGLETKENQSGSVCAKSRATGSQCIM